MQHNILGFYIPMDDLVGVELANCLADLSHDAGYFCFRHWLEFLKLFEKLAAHCHFHKDVDVDCIIEETVHPDDVGVVEEKLNF